MKIILVIIYLVLTISGLVFMKMGGNPGSIDLKDNNVMMSMNLISGLGFVCYICSFLLFTRLVIMFDLSYLFPICAGIVQVAVLVIGYYVFKEHISINSLIGACLIIMGIILMNVNVKNVEKNETVNMNIVNRS